MRPLRSLVTFALVVTLGAALSACDDDDAGPSIETPPSGIERPDEPGRAGDQDNEPQPLEDDRLGPDDTTGSGPGGGPIVDADPGG